MRFLLIKSHCFVKANYSYTGDYNWQKSSNAFSQLKDIIPDLGNTVQNARSNNLNTSFNMDMLYKYLGLTKNSNKSTNRQRASAPKPGEKWSIPMQNHKCRTMNLLMA
jgi:cell surface protein SprA